MVAFDLIVKWTNFGVSCVWPCVGRTVSLLWDTAFWCFLTMIWTDSSRRFKSALTWAKNPFSKMTFSPRVGTITATHTTPCSCESPFRYDRSKWAPSNLFVDKNEKREKHFQARELPNFQWARCWNWSMNWSSLSGCAHKWPLDLGFLALSPRLLDQM